MSQAALEFQTHIGDSPMAMVRSIEDAATIEHFADRIKLNVLI